MEHQKRRKKVIMRIIIVTAVIVAAAAIISSGTAVSEAATEKAVSQREWASVEKTIKTKLGTGYTEAGLCTGYLYWCLKNAYGVNWGNNSTVDGLEKKLVDHGITKVSEGTKGNITEAMKPGDIVIFLEGNSGTHCAILGDGGKLYHARSSAGVSYGPALKSWMELPDRAKNCDRYRVYRGLASEIDIDITVTKKSGDETLTEGNGNYSLEGARYQAVCGEKSLVIVTDKDGIAAGTLTGVSKNDAGKVTIKEIKPSSGYGTDPGIYTKDGSGGRISVVSEEPPVRNPVDLVLYKNDAETGKYENGVYIPQKGGRLDGAVFKVEFYGGDTEAEALRTWYFKTDPGGLVKWDESYFASGYQQSELFCDPDDPDQNVLPLGTVVIKEIVSPQGYIVNEKVHRCKVIQDGESIICDTYEAPVVSEQIKRGDLSLRKTDESTQKSMSGIPFRITSLQEDGHESGNGESHIIVTDENGYASTAGTFNSRATTINGSDEAWNGNVADDALLEPSSGIWFGEQKAADDRAGALPYGRYVIDELPCEANSGYALVEGIEIMITRNDHIIELGNMINRKAEIGTAARDKKSGGKTADSDGIVTIIDEIYYNGLSAGEKYLIRGILMDKAAGVPALTKEGEIVSCKEFTPEKSSGSVSMEFSFDASSLAGKYLVAFEEIFSEGRVIAAHRDINAEEQTVKIISAPDTAAAPNTAAAVPVRTSDNSSAVIFPALVIMTMAAVIAVYTALNRHNRKQ